MMKKVSADKFNQIKSRYKFIKLDIELDASKDIVFYGCEISDKRVLVVGVFNSDIATCAYVTRGEIIECNGRYIIDADELCKCNAHHFADAVMDVPQAELPDAIFSKEVEEESNTVNDSRLGAIDAVNYGEPVIPKHEIPKVEEAPAKENKPINKVEDLIANTPTKVQVNLPKPKATEPPKVTPVMTRGRAFDGELKTPQNEPKRESAIFKKTPAEVKPEPQRNKNPQATYKEPEKKVAPQTGGDDWGSWG